MAIFSTIATLGGLAYENRDKIAGALGDDDGTVPGDCPGQAQIRDGLRRAFANAPQHAMDQFRADVRRICTNPDWPCYHGWNDPTIMARAAKGGHDCTHSSNSRQFVPLVDDFINTWGQEQTPSGSWQTNTAPAGAGGYAASPQVRASADPTAMFQGPSGAPMGIPVWVWILLAVAGVFAVMRATGQLSI